MYAILDTDNKTVVGCTNPELSYEKVLKKTKGKTLIKMTVENSPAGIGWSYVDGKFYPPKGNE